MIEAYNSNQKYGFICISEIYLDCAACDDDKERAMEGYNLVPEDHPSNLSVGIYYKESIVTQTININFLSKYLLCEITVNYKKG